jgi:formate C-acetyltransferase
VLNISLKKTIVKIMNKEESTSKLRLWSEKLKVSVLREAASFEGRMLLVAEAFRHTKGEPFRILQVSHANSHIFHNMPIRIREGELLVGWHPNTHQDAKIKQDLQVAQEYLRIQIGTLLWSNIFASEGHLVLDYQTILNLGLGGIKEQIVQIDNSLKTTNPRTPEKKAFYQAARTSLEALQNLILRYSELAKTMQKEAKDTEWRAQLKRIADICEYISSKPPRTFREAIQLTWFTFLAVAIEGYTYHHCFQPGNIDRYLLPFYRTEKEAGTLNEEEVDALLEQLFIKCNEFQVPHMSALTVSVAGRKADGCDATNELSYKCLEIADKVRMCFPGIVVLWHKDIDEEFMRAACRLLRNGMGQVAFFNSDLIIKGLIRYGIPFKHAIDHHHSCTETTIIGRSNPWVSWPYVNIPMCLLFAMFDSQYPKCGALIKFDCRDFTSGGQGDFSTGLPQTYNELKEAFFKHLEHAANQAIAGGIRDQLIESWYRPFPLLSCFIQNCVKRGKDISHGGALYNFLQPQAVGVPNVVDGLAAIKTLVEDRKLYTLDDFRDAITKDFEGYENLRRAILSECPKYGNNTPWVNDLFAEVAGRWCSAFEGHRNFYGGPVFPGFLCWTHWITFGQATPATPDGRKAGTSLANSMGCTGVQREGALSMFLSACKFDQSRALGGLSFITRFSSSSLKNELGVEKMKNLIETVFELGIYQVQVNLTSSNTLKDAQKHPENYSDLLVRIGGYVVPFTLLPKDAQEEVIARTEMNL